MIDNIDPETALVLIPLVWLTLAAMIWGEAR